MRKHLHSQSRQGIVLLVALAMLGLFSVLIVSYVIATSQVAAITALDQAKAREVLPLERDAESAALSVIGGSSNHHAATYRHSLLEDLYGSDNLVLRVGNQRGAAMKAMPLSPNKDGIDARGFLLRSLDASGNPRSKLFKVPTSLAYWHDDGITPPVGFVHDPAAVPEKVRQWDDTLTGRQLTFIEGPLANMTFQIIRSFGAKKQGEEDPKARIEVESHLEGSVIIDLNQATSTEVEVGGTVYDLFVTANGSPGSLLYSLGSDAQPGVADIDDDQDGVRDEPDEIGYPGSDDYGYRFVINGRPFNGKGSNPQGASGIARNSGPAIDSVADIELQFNTRLLGANAYGGSGGGIPQQDEPWDVADFENMHLAWQPSGHRASVPSVIYGSELDQLLGSHLIPSFHRPSVVNYLMNAPIILDGEQANEAKTFWQIVPPYGGRDRERLITLANRLRRATLRPLNFGHTWGDMDGDGNARDGNPEFTGGNLAPIHWETIESTDNIDTLKTKLFSLGRWLTNGPWDVDNDGDGLPDSVWVDLGLETTIAANGQVIKPMIAALIEDLDGRVNINASGNYRQLLTTKFPGPNPQNITNSSSYFQVVNALAHYGHGGGVGPAEIDFSHLFDEGRVLAPGANGPRFFAQNVGVLNDTTMFYARYGNLMNLRYGGDLIDYGTVLGSYPSSFYKLPGFGDFGHSPAVHRGRDQLARIPYPARQETFLTPTSVMGKSLDISGLAIQRRDLNGNESIDNATSSFRSVLNEVLNQPYENGMDDDKPFTATELSYLLDQPSSTTRLDDLLRDEVQRNPVLRNMITTESRTLEVAETTGYHGVLDIFYSRMQPQVTAGEMQKHLDIMVAPEFRKGGKLNINRGLGNGQDDHVAPNLNDFVDEALETSGARSEQIIARQPFENAFPQILGEHPVQGSVRADYAPITVRHTSPADTDFDGYDSDGDGVVDQGTDHNEDNIPEKIADGQELLARHLYCLMFMLIADEQMPGGLIFPNYPYPDNFINDTNIKNKYVARRMAQWAVNAVDFRDTNASCTRLRYDHNLLDGFQLDEAADQVVWGMERPEIEISETLAFHDKRLRRGLKTPNQATVNPNGDPTLDADGELPEDEDNNPNDNKSPDSDMDQFRIPEASAFVELRSLRSPLKADNSQPRLPGELYTNNQLDLGRISGRIHTLPDGTTRDYRSPVWRLAVGEPVQGDRNKSIRWLYDAERVGDKLADEMGMVEQIDYLTANGTDWANPDDQLNEWREARKHAAEVRVSVSKTNAGEFVTLSDDNFDARDDESNDSRVQLQRFVWFANLSPSTTLNVISNPRSGMKRSNVFYNMPDPTAPADPNNPRNASPLLAPGQFAVVAPRVSTTLGQTKESVSPQYGYYPANQRLEFKHQSNSNSQFRFNYHGLVDSNSEPRTPLYWEDRVGSGAPLPDQNYHVHGVLPIIAKSLAPDVPAWTQYNPYDAASASSKVDLGFNISAPLSDSNYYPAPTRRISDQGRDGQGYPKIDGYYDYANLGDDGSQQTLHYDQPFDHRDLPGNNRSLKQNGWAAVGTHQEAVGIFLQRLADPTSAWHPIDNPYITVDLAPMDLTTFNGEGDVTEEIDRNGDGELDSIADNTSEYDGNDFEPPVMLDSRRKIPDSSRDRLATQLLQRDTGSNGLQDYDRQVSTQRSVFSSSFSLLRVSNPANSQAVFDYELGSLWAGDHTADDAGINSTYQLVDPWAPYHPGYDTEPYRQTLGFINREFGRPVGADNGQQEDRPDVAVLGRGSPRGTIFMSTQWDDRDMQSPLDLIQVPAVSRTGLNTTFSPGTRLENDGKRERPSVFTHLLGFESKFAEPSDKDDPSNEPSNPNWRLGSVVPKTDDVDLATLTGERAPFELVLDLVTTGQPNYLDSHWFDADEVKFIAPSNDRDRLFNRVVEFLQPPFNHVPAYRTPGKINLNTTPDYIRKGGSLPFMNADFLDLGESPHDNTQSGTAVVDYRPVSTSVVDLSSGFANSRLYGDGSVYRSLAWGNSSFYELDDSRGKPSALGSYDRYHESVDTRYGLGFKAFIESRRGYDTALQTSDSSNPQVNTMKNPDLDWRYPTRFAGVFSTAQGAEVPSVQRFMLRKKNGVLQGEAVRRRTHDMTVLRPHPDFDQRLFNTAQKTSLNNEEDLIAYSLNVESNPPSSGGINLPSAGNSVDELRMTQENHGLFERSLPQLQKDFQHRARYAESRFENAARLKNMATHQSNVFLLRFTLAYFVVDPASGAVGSEYENADGEVERIQMTAVIDRSVPVGFFKGEPLNIENTILHAILK